MSITTLDPIEVRRAGMKALNDALGHDATQAFLRQFMGVEGQDIVKELRELPEPPLDELLARVARLDDEYKAGRIDATGRPIQQTVA